MTRVPATLSTLVPGRPGDLDAFLSGDGLAGPWNLLRGDGGPSRLSPPNALGVHDFATGGGPAERVLLRRADVPGGSLVTLTPLPAAPGEGRASARLAAASLARLRRLARSGLPARPARSRAPMPPEALRAELLDLVEGTTGIKGVELALALAERCVERGHEIPSEGINAAMRDLVAEGRVVEVEYLVAETPYRVKSFYLPRGSEVRPIAA